VSAVLQWCQITVMPNDSQANFCLFLATNEKFEKKIVTNSKIINSQRSNKVHENSKNNSPRFSLSRVQNVPFADWVKLTKIMLGTTKVSVLSSTTVVQIMQRIY
jgi:hypothetical protein